MKRCEKINRDRQEGLYDLADEIQTLSAKQIGHCEEKPPCLYVLHMSQKNALSRCQQLVRFECIIQMAPVTSVRQSSLQTGEVDGDSRVDSQLMDKHHYGL